MATVGNLNVNITANINQLRTAISTAQRLVNSLKTSMNTIGNTRTASRFGNGITASLRNAQTQANSLRQSVSRPIVIPFSYQQNGPSPSPGSGGGGGANNLMGNLKRMAIAGGAAFTAKGVIELADSFTMASARLDMINDGLQTTDKLQKMVFQSAQNSRSSYADTIQVVAKLGVLAKDAFSSNQETIQFAELMNKQFVIGGSSIQEQTAAMYQLTQAMAAGKLQGDEFRSIMENAPMLAQAIADYMGLPIGKLKDMSREGIITSDVIKNALFSVADETNAKFAQMPMTFAQVWTSVKNILTDAFMPIIQAIGKGAQWIHDNWSTLVPIFLGLATAVGVYTVATGIQTAVTWLSVAANRALIVTLLSNPILWIALAIGVLIGVIYKWIQSVGGIKVAWLIVSNVLINVWEWIKQAFFTGVYFVLDLFDRMAMGMRSAGVAIANFMGDMKASVLMILQNMVNGAIDIINNFINLLNQIPGVSIQAIGHVQFGTEAQLANEAAKQARNQELAEAQKAMEDRIAGRADNLAKMKADAESNKLIREAEIAAARAEAQKKNQPEPTQAPQALPYQQGSDETEKNTSATKSLAERISELSEQIAKQISLFSGASRNRASMNVLLRNAKTKADAYEMFARDMATLMDNNVFSKAVKGQLANTGVGDVAMLHALSTASPEQQKQWNDLTLKSIGNSAAVSSIVIDIHDNKIADDIDVKKLAAQIKTELLKEIKGRGR